MKIKWPFYLLIATVSIILIIFSLNVFPIPGTDSRVFIPPALMYSRGYGFVNPLYNITFIVGLYKNHNDFFQFNYYVPFYPLLLGIISKISPGIKSFFFICSLFSVANLVLYGWVTKSFIDQKRSMWHWSLQLMSVIYLSTFVFPTVGRPENLSCLLIFLIYILYLKRTSIKSILIYNIFLCLLFSLLLSTQIVGFYFCALFFVTFELLNSLSVFKTVLINLLRFTVIIIGFLIVLSLSPNGILNTLNGIKTHGSWALTRVDRSMKMFIYYWVFAPLNFAFLGIFISAAAFYVKFMVIRLKKLKGSQLLLVSLLHLVILLSIPKFILYASPAVYNATQFIFPLSVYLFSRIALEENVLLKKSSIGITAISYLGGALVFMRWILLFADYKTNGKDYDHAKITINKVMNEHHNARITPALWSLFDNPYDVKFFDGTYKKGDIVIIQQAYARNIDLYLNKATILYDWRISEQRKFMGVPLASTPQCYSFVVCKFN